MSTLSAAESDDLERRIEPSANEGHALDIDARSFAIAALCRNRDEARDRRLQRQMGLRLLHRQNASIE